MFASTPVNWLDPRTWPWVVYVWIAFLLAGWGKTGWRRFQRRRAEGWPLTEGRVESVHVKLGRGGRSPNFVGELSYSYSVAGAFEAGWYRRYFPSEEDARNFVRGLEGQRIAVHYDPQAPSRSWPSEPSLDMLLKNRAVEPGLDSVSSFVAPPLSRPILAGLSWISLAGLVVSLWVHLGALMGKRVAPDYFFWSLHLGIFVVWIPAVFVLATTARGASRKDFWRVALKNSPEWMRYMVTIFTGYAVVNFLLLMAHSPAGAYGSNPPASVWRGFSGHWMAFYSAAFAILYSAAHAGRTARRCLNGHQVSSNSSFCERCGQPVIQAT